MAKDRNNDSGDFDSEADPEQIAFVPTDPHKTQSHHPKDISDHDSAQDASSGQKAEQNPAIGPYRLIRKLGEGGMGSVWMAEQSHPVKRRVALKLIKAGIGSKEIIARFEAERQALALMNHPNIARILDAGTTDEGQPYFVMELVSGTPLTTYCDQNRLGIDERLKLFSDVCSGVQHAHQKGIIHRDLKPGNIIVGMQDGRAVPKIIDFGLAKAMESTQKLTDQSLFTGIGQILGTLKYMSPEQASLDTIDIDTRTDIYALGVILYELLTGSTPLDSSSIKGQAALKVMEFIRDKEPVKPSSKLGSSTDAQRSAITGQRRTDSVRLTRILAGDLDWIVMKALEKDRTRRYETANGFAADIQRYLSNEPVIARPPSLNYRVRKFVRKNRGLVTSLSAIATLLIAGIIGTSWFGFEANAARKQANLKTAEVTSEKEKVELEKQNVERERDRANENERFANVKADEARQSEQKAVESEKAAQAALEETEAMLARSNYVLSNVRWDQNRVREATDLLNQIPAKYRNFEWYYCRRHFQGSDFTCFGHQSSVWAVAFSPDQLRLVTAGWDGKIKIWNAVTGSELIELNGHVGYVSSVAFSPDGTRIVSGGEDEIIRIWDAATGALILEIEGHVGPVHCVAFSPNGDMIASGSELEIQVRIWDATTGNEKTRLVERVIQKPLLLADDDPEAKGTETPEPEVEDDKSWHISSVTSVAFSPDSARIVSVDSKSSAIIWDVATGKDLVFIENRTFHGSNAAFSPDGARIAMGTATIQGGIPMSVAIFDATTGARLVECNGHTDKVESVTFSPDGSQIASGSWDQTLRVWEVATGRELNLLKGHVHRVTDIAFSPDGARIASGSVDGTAKVWDALNGNDALELFRFEGSADDVAFSPDNKQILGVGGKDFYKYCMAWDADLRGSLIRNLHVSEDRANVPEFLDFGIDESKKAYSPDGTRLVRTGDENTIRILDVDSGECLLKIDGHISKAYSEGVKCAVFSDDGTRIVSGGHDRTVRIWDSENGSELLLLDGHSDSVNDVTVSTDGMRIASASRDGTIKIWQAPIETEVIELFGHSSDVVSMSFSQDGNLVFSESDQEKLVWDAKTGELRDDIAWVSISPQTLVTPDQRLQLCKSGAIIRVVDLEFKNGTWESAYRKAKSQPKVWWHSEQAEAAEGAGNWFAAMVHRAWIIKSEPEKSGNYEKLHIAYEKAKADFVDRNLELDTSLPPIVREMLKLPRGEVGEGD